jgi:23S rRNA (cytidine2498-2'-O)-methyltransferase
LGKAGLLRSDSPHLPACMSSWPILDAPSSAEPGQRGLGLADGHPAPAHAQGRAQPLHPEARRSHPHLLTADEQKATLRPGLLAVDLGAAPGGWTWQLVSRGLRVTAIDNGPMAPSVVATGLIEHLRADGFTWKPRKPVEWMVCDMVEQPSRIAPLMADWVASGRCRRSIFNLKLPMKRATTRSNAAAP